MSLPVGQQRMLDSIEITLERGEPRLRSMFAIFTRLTRDDGVPQTEVLRAQTLLRRAALPGPPNARTRTLIALALMLGLVTLFAFMAVNSSGPHGCRPGVPTSRTVSCSSAQGPASHS